MSPMRAAGRPWMSTVIEPSAITSGGPTHTHMSPMQAAGMLPMSTVGAPGPVIGPPTCGMGGTPGVTIGQTCMSVSRAAGLLMHPSYRAVFGSAPVDQSWTRSASSMPRRTNSA